MFKIECKKLTYSQTKKQTSSFLSLNPFETGGDDGGSGDPWFSFEPGSANRTFVAVLTSLWWWSTIACT